MLVEEPVTLREAKMARTRQDLLRAMLLKLKEKPFGDISVRELCAEAMISEGTFFNYFPRKTDLLIYFIQLWSLEAAWVAREKVGANAGIKAVEAVFEYTAQKMTQHPRIMGEIIAIQACGCGPQSLPALTPADKSAAFPGVEGLTDLPSQGLRSLFPLYIGRAVELGELPRNALIPAVTQSVVCVFFGVPIMAAMGLIPDVPGEYRRQLNLVWAGVRAGGEGFVS